MSDEKVLLLNTTRARSICLGKDLKSDALPSPMTRAGSFCFGVEQRSPRTAHLIIDSRSLSQHERRKLEAWKSPVVMTEVRRTSDNHVLSFQSPYITYPRKPACDNNHFHVIDVPLFHFHEPWEWTLPCALLDIRPHAISREAAVELYCEEIAANNHARFAFRALLGQ